MKKQDCFLLGTIFKLHGYKGDVNIYNDNDIPLIFTNIDFFFVEINNELIPYFADSVRPKKKKILLVKFEDVDSEEQALKILKRKVYLPNKFFEKLINKYKIRIVPPTFTERIIISSCPFITSSICLNIPK